MKKILIAFLAAAIFTTAQAADFDKGLESYNSSDYAGALRELKPRAERGDAVAQYAIGRMYENGEGVAKNYAEALKWYRRAAAQGLARAQYNLGWMYDNGKGVAENTAEAMKWYRLAAAQGEADAQNKLGAIYALGNDVPRDYIEAAKWFRLAAKQGDMNGQYFLGMMSAKVNNDTEAAKWYRLAAEQGYAYAQYEIGLMYESGEGVTQNYAEAVKWYRLAAEQGNLVAQKNLARLFSTNETQGDLNKALTYDKFKVEGSTLHYNTAWAKREDKRQITYDDVAGFKKILSDNPKINTVHLTSLGGELFAAKEIANLLIDFELHIHVRDICFSACPFILLGGEKRTMERGAKIGFHKSSSDVTKMKEYYKKNKEANGWRDPFEFTAWLHEATQEDMYDGFKLLIERGVAPDFAIETVGADVGDGWYPRRKELLRARVLTE